MPMITASAPALAPCAFNLTEMPKVVEECLQPNSTGVRTFGFDKGQPCVIIKLNRIIDFVPILKRPAVVKRSIVKRSVVEAANINKSLVEAAKTNHSAVVEPTKTSNSAVIEPAKTNDSAVDKPAEMIVSTSAPTSASAAAVDDGQLLEIRCEGLHSADEDNIGSIDYYPKPGVDLAFFPFRGEKNYLSPLIFVKVNFSDRVTQHF